MNRGFKLESDVRGFEVCRQMGDVAFNLKAMFGAEAGGCLKQSKHVQCVYRVKSKQSVALTLCDYVGQYEFEIARSRVCIKFGNFNRIN